MQAADAAAGGRSEGGLARRARQPDEDQGPVIDALRRWFTGHPGCSDPAEAIRALGLPAMDGLPAERAARTSAQQREYTAARDVLQHAQYALRCRDSR